jgi:hybrid cluster-associated redox disulfide protein
MNSVQSIPMDLSVDQLLKRWPPMASVFLRHRMACLGCSLAAFDTLQDVTQTYQLDAKQFLLELDQALQNPLVQDI